MTLPLTSYIDNLDCVDENDKIILTGMIPHLIISYDDTDELNKIISEQQIQYEISITYLIAKYTDRLSVISTKVDRRRGEILIASPIKIDGMKLTKDKNDAIVDTDEKYCSLLLARDRVSNFVNLLDNMKKIIFGRAFKIETISNNYRAELKADQKV